MPTIVGILTFISMIYTTYEWLKAINFFVCWYFNFYEQLKFRAQLSWALKKFYNLGAWPVSIKKRIPVSFAHIEHACEQFVLPTIAVHCIDTNVASYYFSIHKTLNDMYVWVLSLTGTTHTGMLMWRSCLENHAVQYT